MSMMVGPGTPAPSMFSKVLLLLISGGAAVTVFRGQGEVPINSLASASCAVASDLHIASEIGESVPLKPAASCGMDKVGSLSREPGFSEYSGPADDVQRFRFIRKDRSNSQPAENRTIVWVIGYARSGSSTALSIISVAGNDTEMEGVSAGTPEEDHSIFSLFEPCHWGWWIYGDRVSKRLRKQGCPGLLDAISSCDFSEVKSLYFWNNEHTITPGVSKYSPKAAGSSCSRADMVAFKTIFYGHDLKEHAFPLLNAHPTARVVAIVRDPRGIYASWRTTWPFKLKVSRSLLTDICDKFAANSQIQHPRVFTIVYEDLVKQPTTVVKNVYDFLGMEFGARQEAWIASTFSARCDHQDHYSDCKTDSSEHVAKWKTVMKQDEIDYFLSYPPCRTVAEKYGYEL